MLAEPGRQVLVIGRAAGMSEREDQREEVAGGPGDEPGPHGPLGEGSREQAPGEYGAVGQCHGYLSGIPLRLR